MIVAASTALLADSRSGGHGGVLPWALLVVGSVASLAANVAVAEPTGTSRRQSEPQQGRRTAASGGAPKRGEVGAGQSAKGRDLQRQAWQWTQANRTHDGSLPSGRAIARQYGRHERWGRLVKRSGCAGSSTPAAFPVNPTCIWSDSSRRRRANDDGPGPASQSCPPRAVRQGDGDLCSHAQTGQARSVLLGTAPAFKISVAVVVLAVLEPLPHIAGDAPSERPGRPADRGGGRAGRPSADDRWRRRRDRAFPRW
jgi:hypothetical protein